MQKYTLITIPRYGASEIGRREPKASNFFHSMKKSKRKMWTTGTYHATTAPKM
jgi:hypothetical protein